MGFWGSLGKGLLKAAPIAASFIPGVGPLAAMGIGAATGAASGAMGGGGLKGAISGGLQGGAAGYGGAKMMGKGIGPSGGATPPFVPSGNEGGGWQGALSNIMGMMNRGQQQPQQQPQYGGMGMSNNVAMPRFGNVNMAGALSRGASDAIQNQPFRSGGPFMGGELPPIKTGSGFFNQFGPRNTGVAGGRKRMPMEQGM